MSRQSELAALGRVADTGALSNRNLIINGAMKVAQRGTSSTITTSVYSNVDRFSINRDFPTGVTSISTSQDSDAPSGFANSLKIEPDQARTAALSSADRLFLNYNIEAQDLQHLDYNTSSAKTLTLSFWIKSNLTGIVSLEINAADSTDTNYQYFHESVTINSADTWEYKTISIAGNVNNPIDDDNGSGIGITWVLAAGPVFTSGTFETGSWHDTTAGDRASSSNIDIYSSTSNYVSLTGVQLELGDTATDFEHRSYGDELQRCLRYYWQAINIPSNTGTNRYGFYDASPYSTSTAVYGVLQFPVRMRTAPTFSVANLSSFKMRYGADVSPSNYNYHGVMSETVAMPVFYAPSNISGGRHGWIECMANARASFDAEL